MQPDLLIADRAASIRAMMAPYLTELIPGGLPDYPHLGLYWRDRHRLPYLLRVADQDAGFALVRSHVDTGFHEMAEFYVRPAFRRHGVGREAASMLFARHAGWWNLQVLDDNVPAQAFWAAVIPGAFHRERRVAANGRRYSVIQFEVSGEEPAQP
jgi:predicted acetyltransferase